MKNIKLYIIAVAAILFSSCMKEDRVTFTDTIFEWDAALNSKAAGLDYAILVRVPAYNKIVTNSDPSITRTSGTVKLRVNLVGPQRTTETILIYRVLPLTANTATPNIQPAVQGTHFNTSGTLTIPANSSFGEASIDIINSGVSSIISRDLVLEIVGSDNVKPSENFKRIGIRIAEN